MIDNYYYFDKSTKRKAELVEYCVFCDTEYRKILKHVSTRWLTLELTVDRTLRVYPGLKSYFGSEGTVISIYNCTTRYKVDYYYYYATYAEVAGVRFDRLQKAYTDPMTEVFLMFYQASLQLFISMNKFLQREDPLIAVLAEQLISFLKKLLAKFVTISAIKAASNIVEVDYSRDKQLPGIISSNVLYIAINIVIINFH